MRVASPETLIDQAMSKTGLSDFGPSNWRDGLDRLVDSLSESDFGDTGRARIEAKLTEMLSTRLRIEDWIKARPEILQQKIDGPVFILGLPRTATTALQAFLCNDPQWRFLRGWEAAEPVPPPDSASEAHDPRRLAEIARQESAAVSQSLHIAEAGGPVDDQALLRLNFHNQELGWPAWSYTRWWRDCDMTSTYAYHERVLKLLQSKRPPNRWLVKAPWHNFHIETLAQQYPGARFVMCHRDPAQLIPSVASLLMSVHQGQIGQQAASPEAIGAFVLEHLTVSIARVTEFRRRHGDARFIDVGHAEFNADAFSVLDKVYGWLDVHASAQARADMEAWVQRNRKGAHGEHRYTAEQFGLTRTQIREAFGDYIAQFEL